MQMRRTATLLSVLAGLPATGSRAASPVWIEEAGFRGSRLHAIVAPMRPLGERILATRRFQVRLDGREAPIVGVFENPDPVRIAIVVDTSGPARAELRGLVPAWGEIFSRLPATVPLALWLAGPSPRQVSGRQEALAALAGVAPSGPAPALGTALEAALAWADGSGPRRDLVWVVAMGSDPALDDDDPEGRFRRLALLTSARKGRAALHTLGVGTRADRPLLRQLAEATRGTSAHGFGAISAGDTLRAWGRAVAGTVSVWCEVPPADAGSPAGTSARVQIATASGDDLAVPVPIPLPSSAGSPPSPLPPTTLPPATVAPPSPPSTGPAPPPPAGTPATPATTTAPPAPAVPVLALPAWFAPGDPAPADDPSRELAGRATARLGLLASRADSSLVPLLRQLEIAVRAGQAPVVRTLFEQVSRSFAFLGSLYGETVAGLEADLDAFAAAHPDRPEPVGHGRSRLAALRVAWESTRTQIRRFGERLGP